jgi:hypothetical protein
MERAFLRGFCCVIFLAVCNLLPTTASAVTLSYEYSGTGNVSFQSDTTLNLGGTCLSPCVISAVMTIAGAGPAFNPSFPSGWTAGASATITDNLGDKTSFPVNTGDVPFGTFHEINGSFLLESVLPSALDISTLSFASFLDGPGTVDYSISISLPNGAYVTPLPDALPLFATGLGLIGMLGWRRKRKLTFK